MNDKIPENQIILGDCVQGMKTLPDKMIPLTVTSPPYDALRTYDGFAEWDFMDVAKEIYRITMPGVVVVWVVQEQIIDGSESGESSRQRLAFANIGFRLHSTMVMAKLGGSSALTRSVRASAGVRLHLEQGEATALLAHPGQAEPGSRTCEGLHEPAA